MIGIGIGVGCASGGASGPSVPTQFIDNGALASSTNWTITSGWTIGSGVATNTLAGGTRRLTQVFGPLTAALISGNNYVLTFDAGNAVNVQLNAFAYIGAYDGSGQLSVPAVSTGPVSVSFTAGTASTTISFSLAGAQPTGMTLDNVSLVPA